MIFLPLFEIVRGAAIGAKGGILRVRLHVEGLCEHHVTSVGLVPAEEFHEARHEDAYTNTRPNVYSGIFSHFGSYTFTVTPFCPILALVNPGRELNILTLL